MSGCKYSIGKILNAGAALFLMLPGLAWGEFGICPPYSKTFGPDDPWEEILAFVEEVNARPGGGTIVFDVPGEYQVGGYRQVTGTLCVRSNSPGPENPKLDGGFSVIRGGMLTVRSVDIGFRLGVGEGSTLFVDAGFVQDISNLGTAYIRNSEIKWFGNHGLSVVEDGKFQADGYLKNTVEGYLRLSGVRAYGVENSGTVVVSRGNLGPRRGCFVFGESGCREVAAIENRGIAEVAYSTLESCVGPVTDLGHNAFRAGRGCIATDPTSTYYNGEAVEVDVRTTPYWRSVGTVHLDTDSPLFVSVFSTPEFDARLIDYYTIDIEGFDEAARRGGVYRDSDRDGLVDYVVWYRLDRQLRLDCGYYDNAFSAMTADGLSLTGRLQFEAVGCTP